MNENIYNNWHPLIPYIKTIIFQYQIYHDGNKANSFDEMWEFYRGCEAANECIVGIFTYLHWNQYKHYVIFRYENLIKLSDLGCDIGTMFDKNYYNGLFRECRSCVVDLNTMTIALASFTKFKNIDEDDDEWKYEHVLKTYVNSEKVYITNKLDGNYAQMRYIEDEDDILVSSSLNIDPSGSPILRGIKEAITSEQLRMVKDNPDWTFIFEWINCTNPIVVKYEYKDEGLHLLGMRNVYTGAEKCFDELEQIAKKYGSRITEWYKDEDLEHIISITDQYGGNEKEGWVIDMVSSDNSHFRAKLKCDDYRNLHKYLSKKISPNLVIEAIKEGSYDDIISKVPKAYVPLMEEYFHNIQEYLALRRKTFEFWYNTAINDIPINERTDRKTVALAIQNKVPKDYMGETFGYAFGYKDKRVLDYNYTQLMEKRDEYRKILKNEEN